MGENQEDRVRSLEDRVLIMEQIQKTVSETLDRIWKTLDQIKDGKTSECIRQDAKIAALEKKVSDLKISFDDKLKALKDNLEEYKKRWGLQYAALCGVVGGVTVAIVYAFIGHILK